MYSRQGLKQMRKIKVLGHPFAGSAKQGSALTPQWLKNEQWFKNLKCSSTNMAIEYEEIKVSKSAIPHDEVLIHDY